MAEPTKKAPEIDNLITGFVGRSRVESIKADTCILCSKPAVEFKDDLSRKEYTISGMCQVCQDKTFG